MWNKPKREWKPRVKGHGTMIARVYSAHPGEGARFYLRMLLNHVTGCTSFQDIRTLPDGTVCDTYKEAALRRGLLEDDQEVDQCLAEAATCSMPAQLRQLFVTILLFVEPSIPLALWDKYKASFAEDFLCRARTVFANVELDEHILNCVLLDLEYRLQKHGKSLADYPGMPIPTNVSNPYEESRIIMDELDYNFNEQNDIVSQNLPLLNADQLSIYNIIIAAVNDTNSYSMHSLSMDPEGPEKLPLNTLLSMVHSQGNIALAMASSGIAALLLQGGRTVHSGMKVPIHLNEICLQYFQTERLS